MNSKFILFVFCISLFFSCSKDNEKTLYVADTLVNCTGVSTQKCLQIKENEKDNWTSFYGKIEGFNYEVGYAYKLKVEVSKVENPAADASSIKYILLEVLDKTKTPVSLAKGSWMVVKIKDRNTFDRNPVITLTMPQGQIQGSTSCNKFFGSIDLENNNFKVSNIGSTKMMCKSMETEQLFLETLNEVVSYKIENDYLKLMTADQSVVMQCSYMVERE